REALLFPLFIFEQHGLESDWGSLDCVDLFQRHSPYAQRRGLLGVSGLVETCSGGGRQPGQADERKHGSDK
ncbi:MAG: hypothetical protein ACYSUQ_08765, partial [Planctomycetota bacterium]